MPLNLITVSRTSKKQNSRITNNIAVKDFSSVHMNKAEQLYTRVQLLGEESLLAKALFSGIYTPLHGNTHPQIFLPTFQLGQYLPNDLKGPILWLHTITPLICNYTFSRKHSRSLEIQKMFLKKPNQNLWYRDWRSYCVSIHPKTLLHTSRRLFCFALKGMGFPVFSLLTQVNVVQDCPRPRCCPCWLHSSDISFVNCLLQPFSSELQQQRQKTDVWLY